MFYRKYHLNRIIWILIIGTTISRLGTSMTVPFISFFLHEKVGLSLYAIGWIIGASFFAYALGGFWGGALSDFLGRPSLLLGSLFIYALTFMGFAFSSSLSIYPYFLGSLFLILNLISGVCRSWYETLAQTLIADLAPSDKKAIVFGFRYTAANIGTAIGPVIGALLGLSGSMKSFYVTGSIFICYFFLLLYFLKKQSSTNQKPDTKQVFNFQKTLHILKDDKTLMYFIIGGILVYFGFVQQEALFAQIIYIKLHNIKIFSLLLALNATLVILLQIPLSHILSKHYAPLKIIMAGVLLIAFGLFGFGISTTITFFILSEIVFTLGEILIFSHISVVIDSLAPVSLRGAYFGASSLQFFGRAIGPIIGGILLQNYGITISFTFIATIVASSSLLFFFGNQHLITQENKKIVSDRPHQY